jgi:transposase
MKTEPESVPINGSAPDPDALAQALKYGLNTGQLYTWRRQMLRRVPAVVAPADFARVDVVEDPERPASPTPTVPKARSGLTEVILPGGTSVRVDECVDEQALRRVLTALRG